MTDTPPSAAPPTPPPAAAGAPMAAGPKQTLSLVSFIVGLAAFVFSWVAILGLAAGVVAVILGFRAKKTEPGAPSWMPLIGIIAGFVAIGIGIIVLILWIVSIIAFASIGNV